MKVTFSEKEEFKFVTGSDSTGFYRDSVGNLYVVHAYGVSRLDSVGGTASYRFGDSNVPQLQKVNKGTINITF